MQFCLEEIAEPPVCIAQIVVGIRVARFEGYDFFKSGQAFL